MDLETWLNETGMANAARLLNVSYKTVCGWKYKRSVPSAKNIEKILRASRGRVTLKAIAEG
jgi:DNA-binding transcriptional regulator YdaS (Cro superfamily)